MAGTRAAAALGVALLGYACEKQDTDDTASAVLPADSAAPEVVEDSGPGSFPIDTFADSGGLAIDPQSTLSVAHTGFWQQSPEGGPYVEMTGELVLEEILDGAQPWCRASLGMVGLALPEETGCEGCDTVYEVGFVLLGEGPTPEEAEAGIEVGGLADCVSPDLPADGESWRMGWNSVESAVYFDYYRSGVWLPWYSGEAELDRVDFSYLGTIGFHRPEDEEEDR